MDLVYKLKVVQLVKFIVSKHYDYDGSILPVTCTALWDVHIYTKHIDSHSKINNKQYESYKISFKNLRNCVNLIDNKSRAKISWLIISKRNKLKLLHS